MATKAPNIDDAEFWDAFDMALYGKTAEVLLSIFLAGGKVGTSQLPTRSQILLNWDTFNKAAQEYLKLYRLESVPMFGATTRENVVRIISDWMESGEPFQLLPTRLEPWLGQRRAERIAVTEVTRTYAAGNIAAWKSSGLVTAKVWATASDELVCPYCGNLNGKIVDIDSDFHISAMDLPGNLANAGDFVAFAPPAHVNCRCWLQPQVSEVSLRERIREGLYE